MIKRLGLISQRFNRWSKITCGSDIQDINFESELARSRFSRSSFVRCTKVSRICQHCQSRKRWDDLTKEPNTFGNHLTGL